MRLSRVIVLFLLRSLLLSGRGGFLQRDRRPLGLLFLELGVRRCPPLGACWIAPLLSLVPRLNIFVSSRRQMLSVELGDRYREVLLERFLVLGLDLLHCVADNIVYLRTALFRHNSCGNIFVIW